MAKRSKLYLIFSHGDQDSDFEIDFATSDLAAFESMAEEYELELDTDLLSEQSYQDLGFDDNLLRHYHAYAFDMKVRDGMELFALCANGDEEYCWIGAVEGVFSGRDEARRALIEKTGLDEMSDWDEEKIGRELKNFDAGGCYTDANCTYWQCLPFRPN